MTLDSFVKDVEEYLTIGCALPFKLKREELLRIIKYSKKWMYKNYEYAVQEGYCVIPQAVLKGEEFKMTRNIKLDECIQAVNRVERVNEGRIFSSMGDFNVMRSMLMQGGITNSQSSRMDMPFFIATQLYYDVMKSVLLSEVTYNFNFNTNDFSILGETPKEDLVLTCLYNIPDEALFEDELFFRYVIASSKMQLGRMLSTIKMPLIGNAEIDYDSYKSEGQEELQSIKEEIANDEGLDYFIMR